MSFLFCEFRAHSFPQAATPGASAHLQARYKAWALRVCGFFAVQPILMALEANPPHLSLPSFHLRAATQ